MLTLGVWLLLGVFVLVEIFAISAYRAGRNTVLIALVESGWIGWLVAVIWPITI